MEIKFKLKLKRSENSTSNNLNQDMHNKKNIVIIITAIIICLILFCGKAYVNVVVIGNDSDNNTVEERNSGITVDILPTTDETTVTPEN